MKSILLTALFGFFTYVSSAQFLIVTDNVDGRPLTTKHLENNPNTSYLFNETYKGSVVMMDGNLLPGLNVLYDLKLDAPMFIDPNGNFLKFNKTPLSFEMTNADDQKLVFKRGFPAIDKNTELSFYQVLVDGDIKLLKKYSKGVTEAVPYGGVRVEKTNVVISNYYLYDGKELRKIKKDPKSLANDLKMQGELSSYLSQLKEKSTSKKESSNENLLVALVQQSNALRKKN